MGWREKMMDLNSNPQEQKPQKEQKPPEQPPFTAIDTPALKNSFPQPPSAPPPDCRKILPKYAEEYTTLWYKAWIIADLVDGTTAPYPERAAKLPELAGMVERMRTLENMPKPDNKSQYAERIQS